MGFFDFLKSKNNDWKKTLVKDLVMLTAVDGDMNQDEIKLVLNIAVNELGFSEKEFIGLMENLGDVKDIYPSDIKDKIDYIKSLIRITYSDGYIDENEIKYMKIVAKRMVLPENLIDNAIANIEKDTNIDEDENSENSSSIKVIITSPFSPTVDIQSEQAVKNYLKKISNLSKTDLCIELSNVMAAKHNLMAIPSGINSFTRNQEIVTDLTDKALTICIISFGQEPILNYCNHDIRVFNELVNEIDNEIAELQLISALHGKEILDRIKKVLSI